MMAGRKTKRTPELEAKILEYLEAGNTRRASCLAVGISEHIFYDWLNEFPQFLQSVTQAESRCEVAYGVVLKKAATGFKSVETRVTDKTVFRKRITTKPDGTVIEDHIPVNVTETTTTTSQDFDWKAAESWLKRRRKEDWSERVEADDVSKNAVPMSGYEIFPPGTRPVQSNHG